MNENPGETPNPLNPASEPIVSSEPIEATVPSAPAMPPAPAQPANGAIVSTESLDPAGRPMEQVANGQERPKKKTGLIAGIIAGLVVVLGCAVAAVVLLTMHKPDPVVAMGKILSGQTPKNIVVDGTIGIELGYGDYLPFDNININVNSSFNQENFTNASTTKATASANKANDVSVTVSEAFVEDGDLYFKVDGLVETLNDTRLKNFLNSEPTDNPTTVDCIIDAETGDEICGDVEVQSTEEYNMYLDVAEMLDGEWLRISAEELSDTTGGLYDKEYMTCIKGTFNKLNDDTSMTDLYTKNPFIVAESENLPIQKKKDTLFKINIDGTYFANYLEGVQNTAPFKSVAECLEYDVEDYSVDKDAVKESLTNLPDIYIELDGNNNITRLYFEKNFDDDYVKVKTDLSFSYPDSVTIREPENYKNLNEAIEEINYALTGQYNVNAVDVEELEEYNNL